jgi:hypothetical protein
LEGSLCLRRGLRVGLINEGNAGELAVFNIYVTQGGYMVEAGEQPVDTLNTVIEQIRDIFKY